MKKWQLQEAKRHLEELVDNALHGEMQEIVKPTGGRVYIVSAENYKVGIPKESFKEILLSIPKTDNEELFERAKGKARNIEL